MTWIDPKQVVQHCELLGIKPGEAHFRAIHWNGGGAHKIPPDPSRSAQQLDQLQRRGFRLYLIPGGGQCADEVRSIPAAFAEWDGLLPEDAEAHLYQLQVNGLPEPTLTLTTWAQGSLHAYWRFDQPCTDIPRWRALMRRLVVALGSDQACTDPSRCMRLAGSSYIAKQGHPRAGEALGRARITHENADATTTLEELEAWVDAEFQRHPYLLQLQQAAGEAKASPPTDEERQQRRGGSLLPPRPIECITSALEAIPKRTPGLPEGDPWRYPRHRLVAAGLRDALYRLMLQDGIAPAEARLQAHQKAVELMETHSPSKGCGWHVPEVLSSSLWLDEGCFWAAAIEAGWKPPKTEGAGAAVPSSDAQLSTGGPIPLGHEDGEKYAYRCPKTGQVTVLPRSQHNCTGLLSLAPMAWWKDTFPRQGGDESGPPKGVDWVAAASAMFEAQRKVGPLDYARLRGRGVWLDEGRIVWHQGTRLVVDGTPLPLHGIETRFVYTPAPDAIGDRQPQPLDDATGSEVLALLQRIGWERPIEGVYLAGAAVLGPVGGALSRRPVLMTTAKRGSGKSTAVLSTLGRLWGGSDLHHQSSAPTEAFIRQTLGASSVPVAVDEWEKVAGRKTGSNSAGFLELLRVSFDGTSTGRGTAHGKALRQGCRALFVLAGINVSHEDAALHSRTVLIRKQWLPAEQWEPVEQQLARLVTAELGRRLVARTVAHLHTLLHNIEVLHQVVVAQLQGTETNRLADVQAHFLAGALLLTTTRRLDGTSDAQRWLDQVGWSPTVSGDSDAPEAGDEGQQALAQLLAHPIRWPDDPSGAITVRELVAIAAGRSGASRSPLGYGVTDPAGPPPAVATKPLGRLGLKVEDGFLLVANTGPEVGQVFAGTRWAEGGHRARLLDLEGAESLGRTARFPSGPSCRAVRLPLSLVLQEGENEVEP